MVFYKTTTDRGFTLIELLVVISIIGILASIVMMSLSESRLKGRDGAKKSQFAEILKGLELYYSDSSTYPNDGTPADNTIGATYTTIGSGFIGGLYMKLLPSNSDEFQYCVSADRRSMTLAVNTEQDYGGSNYCNITRGPGPDFGCTTWLSNNASTPCVTRF